LLVLVRRKPFDTSTPDGRSKERLRRALLTTASSVIVRVISMAGPLITVPLALGYLGHERYGLWMTVIAILGMFTFADLGLGNGLMTEISQADGRDDMQESRRCIVGSCSSFSLFCFLSFPGHACSTRRHPI
jgi:O-antigen/teichoic acid export membrane protein